MVRSVGIFRSDRGHKDWNLLTGILKKRDVKVHDNIADADVSIVISGRFINLLILKGKKVLAYNAHEWLGNVPVPSGFNMYKPVLDEYYDDYIDLTGISVEDCAEKIIKYIGKCNND